MEQSNVAVMTTNSRFIYLLVLCLETKGEKNNHKIGMALMTVDFLYPILIPGAPKSSIHFVHFLCFKM